TLRPPSSTLCPSTTLFRSRRQRAVECAPVPVGGITIDQECNRREPVRRIECVHACAYHVFCDCRFDLPCHCPSAGESLRARGAARGNGFQVCAPAPGGLTHIPGRGVD